ncbi:MULTISPECIES: low affinity iron permease family protein [Pseudomonas]|jgi:low affinity Fe/Cu permease|uniref:Membrane protein n=1 Tax=Pseudomonas putida S13.1.2 TaxID=1384061 RepID=A0AAU8S1Q0_PSEPU|nr:MULTISPECIES: low affinity iron permease family protein [Pseudomonas]AJQ46892.1 membrane protein [Pseudomonas putida S13.1.2]MCS4064162.1 low affinity Fe/Cu permease [Pseudomonas putida]NQD54651.1 low affinity iron permease family protein [Pseudomonas sp. CM25]
MKFAQFCQWLAKNSGRPRTFLIAVSLIIFWAVSGPWFHYNDTWQLIINTSTTIITFLMVFLIQNTQNRDNDIIHVKLDELIRATKSAERSVLDLEALDNRQIHELRKEYRAMGSECEHEPSPLATSDGLTKDGHQR